MFRRVMVNYVLLVCLVLITSVNLWGATAGVSKNSPSAKVVFKNSSVDESIERKLKVGVSGVLKRVDPGRNDLATPWQTGTWTNNVSSSVIYTGLQKAKQKAKSYQPKFSGKAGPAPGGGEGGGTNQDYEWKVDGKYELVEVTIENPNENDVFLKGQEIIFESKINPKQSGATYSWSVIEGTCLPGTSILENFITTIISSGTIKIKLVATVGGISSQEIRSIKAVVPEVIKISWKNDHKLKDANNNNIVDPVWIKTLAGNVIKNKPGAYTKSGNAIAELEIEASKALTSPVGVQVQGVAVAGNDENFYPTGATFNNWTWSAGELQLYSSPLYVSLNFYDTLEVKWEYRIQKDNGWSKWHNMNQSSHMLYTTLATPVTPEVIPRSNILDYACRWAANQSTKGNVCSKILSNGFSTHYTWEYDCHRLSSDFIRLIASVGIRGTQHNWASKGSQASGNVGWMCYQRTKSFAAVGGTASVKEWSWHQWAESSGAQRDPSAAVSKPGNWGGYEDNLFTDYYECINTTPFSAMWVSNKPGTTSGCEIYPTNCVYNSNPTTFSWRGPNR